MSGMKKFFGIGLLALLTTAYFTSSCSRDDFSGSMIDAKAEAFNEVFIETYGTPNPQHDWGFGTGISPRAFTRSENANANEWADPNKAYGGLKVPPPLTPAQIAVVKKYFQTHRNLGYEDPQWTHYFIQQVYKGHTDVPQGCATPEAYMAADGTTYLIASDYMDHLAAIDGSFVDHINNFNHGDCSENGNVLDNGGNANDGPFHTDKIMYMYNSTTKHFGYFNSNGSLCHTNYTGLVSYATIMQEMGSEADCLNDGWNRSFMGFDFEQMIDDQCYATENNAVKNLTIWGNYIINGSMQTNYVYQYNSQPVKMLSDQMNRYCGDKRTVTDAQLYTDVYDANNNNAYVGKQLNTAVIDGLLDDGYLPVDNKNLREWVKVGGCADGYFSDWIVTLTEAKRQDGGDIPTENADIITVQEILDGRIFCEDLGSSEKSDIDYNDVVFDAFTYVTKSYKVPYTLDGDRNKVYDYNSKQYLGYIYNKTDINLLAAGGTITISAAGQDVNQELGIDKSIMANTYVEGVSPNNSGYSNFNNGVSPVKFTVNNPSYVDLINIPIVVKMGTEVTELQAIRGSVPQKFLAPVGTPWIPERVEIQNGFPQFSNWVKTTATPWGDLAPNNLYNLKFVSNFSINSWGGSIENFWADMNLEYPALFVDGDNQITITLGNGQSLQEGDQIAITGYRKNADNAAGTLYIKCNGNVVAQTQDYNNISYDAYPNTFVFSVPSDLVGYSSFQLSRDLNGAQIYITGITVIGGLGAQRVGNYSGGNDNGNNDNNNGNNNDGTTPPEVTGPTGHTATWSGTQAFTVNADGTWSGNVWFDSNTPAFNNMGNGTYIRIYGYGTSNNWQVQLARQLNQDPWTELDDYRRTGSFVNTSTTIDFGPLSAEEVKDIKDDGKLYVHGKNFVVKYIDIDNTGVNTGGNSGGGTTDYEGTVLWDTGGTQPEIASSRFTTAQVNNTIRIYVNAPTSGYWHVVLVPGGWSKVSQPSDWNIDDFATTFNSLPANFPGYVDYTIGNNTALSDLKDNGLIIQSTGLDGTIYKITAVTLIQ